MTATIEKVKILLMIVFLILAGIIIASLVFLLTSPIGPGLPPDQDFSATLVSPQSITIQNCSVTGRHHPIQPDLCVEEVMHGHYPGFPELTPMTSYLVFSHAGSSGKRVAVFWYFNRKDDFDTARDRLLEYLKRNGRISAAELDPAGVALGFRNTSQDHAGSPARTMLQKIPGTVFTGNNTAGYFFVVNQPISASREDFFIEYFGLIGDTDLETGSADLKDLIVTAGDSYYLFSGKTSPLEGDR